VTLCAASGPRFVSVIAYVAIEPLKNSAPAESLVTRKSAVYALMTTSAVLLTAIASPSALTDALFVIEPLAPAATSAVIVNRRRPPGGKLGTDRAAAGLAGHTAPFWAVHVTAPLVTPFPRFTVVVTFAAGVVLPFPMTTSIRVELPLGTGAVGADIASETTSSPTAV
jgi:hypothetical protein